MSRPGLLSRAVLPAAAGSLGALASQALMAWLLLRLYAPEAVGEFSVFAQIAFAWATLALAQSTTGLLAHAHLPVADAARHALCLSLRRWLLMLPPAGLAWAWWWQGQAGAAGQGSGWGTAAILVLLAAASLLQGGWLLAQGLTLRVGGPAALVGVRVLPPLAAAALAAAGALWLAPAGGATLLAAACAGYGLGCGWLLAPLRSRRATVPCPAPPAGPAPRAALDDRSERLKLVHTATDVTVATGLAVHWAGLYGAQEAGCLLLLLRVLGFVPALLGSAWSQVVLSRPQERRPATTLVWITAGAALAVLVVLVLQGLAQGLIPGRWEALRAYVLPLALWQLGAALAAAVSYRPFLAAGKAAVFSRQCLLMNGIQMALLMVPPWLGIDRALHLWVFSLVMAALLAAQAWWMSRL